MAFQQGLSGLNASSRSLDVIGNNIANANTVGMKSSRTEFADIVAASIGVSGSSNMGLGVAVETVSQQFTQGNITITGNDLDIAINGRGFFQLTLPDGSIAYSRNGQFKLDATGNIVSNAGGKLMGYPTDLTGKATSVTAQPLSLPTSAPIAAKQTTNITAEFNLDARASTVYNAGTNTPPYTTYGTALSVYDSQGVPIPFGVTFTRAATIPGPPALDAWDVRDSAGAPLLDGGGAPIQLQFDATGKLVSPVTMPTITIPTPSAVTPSISATLDVSKVTQYGAPFAVSNLTQDGYAPGEFIGLKIADSGVISARYSNGQTQAAGMIALGDFRNVQGLSPVGGNNWVETYNSGNVTLGQPGVGKLGAVRAGSLEESNVDLTAELVNMMTAQRAYQANAQTIKTQDQIMSTLVNLR
jgi:flagellar hook protein FlgE